MPRLAKAPLERCGPGDVFHDYVLAPYEPLVPAEGLLRNVNLLVESFALAGVEAEGSALVDALRGQLGSFRTVWGIKQKGAALAWELYFYDFERTHEDLNFESVLSILQPFLYVARPEVRTLPWHMFSVEFGPEALRGGPSEASPGVFNLYIDLRSYRFADGAMSLENIYSFHDTSGEIDEVLHRLRYAPHYDPARDTLSALIPPHLQQCERICVANKRHADALYFSRMSTRSLLRFMEEHDWHPALVSFVASRSREHAHLLWDVGLDFARSERGRARVRKTGLFGSF